MTQFSHVKDWGVRSFLEGPIIHDYNLFAHQIRYAQKVMEGDVEGEQLLSCRVVEKAGEALFCAELEFGRLSLEGCFKYLRQFWEVRGERARKTCNCFLY